MADKSYCGSCGREIVFAISPTGAAIPIVSRATAAYDLVERNGQVHAVKVREETVHISHFVDCPNVGAWARNGRPRVTTQRPPRPGE